jgi:hypothetical protein
MPINFPDTPTIGLTHTVGNQVWAWNGATWVDGRAIALQDIVDSSISLLVDSAPGALNTLNELAAALGDDENFATTVTNSLAGKALTVHSHPISEVTSLQDALDAKKSEAVYEIAADSTLLANSRYFVNTTAVRTLTLPSSPAVGAEIWIADQSNQAATFNITVNNGGSLINGVSDTLVINVNGAIGTLVYTGSTLGWRI